MSDIPTSWSWSTIGELAQYIQRGKSPKYTEYSELPVINQKCIRWNKLELQHLKFIHPEQFAGWDAVRYIAPGDILWNSTGTGTVGRAYLVREIDCQPPKVVDSHVTLVRAASDVDVRYLFNWIKGPAVQSKIEEMCDGTTNQIELSRAAIAATRVPVAPSAEQTRIADQLDTLLARVQACNDRIDAIPALLKRFRQAVLATATSGKLTEDWRSVPISDSWRPSTVGELLQGKPRNGYSPKAVEFETPVRSLTLSATTSGRFIGRHSKFIDESIPKDSHLWLAPGDILIQRANSLEYVGVSAIFDGPEKQYIYPDLMMKCRPNGLVRGRFLFYTLSAERTRKYFRENATGTTGNMPKINQQTVMFAPVSLPPLEEQDEIVARVDSLFKLADRIEARYTAARAQAQRLTPLLLAKAFRGELVPQDSNDEPASALLQRIASAQSAKMPPPRGRPHAQRKAPPTPPVPKPTDWTSLPDGAWTAPEDPDGLVAMVWLTAVLRAWDEPMPEREARLATLLCQQPRLFTAVLPAVQAAPWSRLIGDEARPLPTQLLHFQPAINGHWGRVIRGMRARGDLVEASFGDHITWALGPGAAGIETVGWADGRARFVVAYLRTHGIASVLPLLESSAQEFVYAKAA